MRFWTKPFVRNVVLSEITLGKYADSMFSVLCKTG